MASLPGHRGRRRPRRRSGPGHQQHRPDRRQRPALLDHPERRRAPGPRPPSPAAAGARRVPGRTVGMASLTQATGVAGDLVGGQGQPGHQQHRPDRRQRPALLDHPERRRAPSPATKPGGGGTSSPSPAGLWGWLVSQATGVTGDLVGGQAARPSAASARPSATSCPLDHPERRRAPGQAASPAAAETSSPSRPDCGDG